MKRIIGSLMLLALVLGPWVRDAHAQQFTLKQVPELISFVSFRVYPSWTIGDATVASTFTVIASLASYETEVYQARFWALNSLTSFKLRQGSGWVTPSRDLGGWMPLQSINRNDANATAFQALLPFSEALWLIPAAPGINIPAAQQYWTKLDSASRFEIAFQGGGVQEVQGFARFRYVPIRQR